MPTSNPTSVRPKIMTSVLRIMKYCLAIFLLLTAAGVVPASELGSRAARKAAPVEQHPFTVVIDAGHGGKDPGCVGRLTNEKTVNLNVARALGRLIQQNCKDVKVVYTREDDRFLTLKQRADIAHRNKGDLFISIHVNSVDQKARNRDTVAGASVYAVGVEKSQSALGVAMRENAVIELEEDYTARYCGFDPQSAESYIIFELSNDLHLRKSLDFANLAQRELVCTAGRKDMGVRQAGFWVLWATSMPAVLVELDFICNPESEKFLASEGGVNSCATALNNAFSKYFRNYQARSLAHQSASPSAIWVTTTSPSAKKNLPSLPVAERLHLTFPRSWRTFTNKTITNKQI